MANSYINLEKIGQRMLPRFLENLLMPQLSYRDYAQEFVNGLGTGIQIRKPFDFVANEFSEDAGIQTQDINERSIPIVLDKISDVSISVGALEMAMNMGETKLNEIIDGMAVALARKVNNDGLKMVGGSSTIFVKDATPYDLDDFSDIRKVFNDKLAPVTERNIIWNTAADADLTRIGNLIKVNEAGENKALREGEIGRVFGIDNYMAQTLPQSDSTHVLSGTLSVIGAHTIKCESGTCTVVPGDVLEFARDDIAVVKEVKLVGSDYMIEVGADITGKVLSTVTVKNAELSFGFHKNALAFVTRPLMAPAGDNSKSATVSYNGIALRLVRDYDMQHKKDIISVDILYNYTMVTPEHAIAIVKDLPDSQNVADVEEVKVEKK